MPWRLRKAPKNKWGDDAYWVIDDTGKHYSKDPMPKEQARQQQKALYANEPKHVAPGKKGGAEPAPAQIPTFKEYLASKGIPVGSFATEQTGENSFRAITKATDTIDFDEAKFKELMKAKLTRAKFNAKPRTQSYADYSRDFERVQRDRATRNKTAGRRQELDMKLAELTNKAYRDYITEYPEAEEVSCNIGEDGERLTKPDRAIPVGECKRRHIVREKKKSREGVAGAIVGALTDVADVAVDFLPGVGKVVGEIYKATAPVTSKYYGQGKFGTAVKPSAPAKPVLTKKEFDIARLVVDLMRDASFRNDWALATLPESKAMLLYTKNQSHSIRDYKQFAEKYKFIPKEIREGKGKPTPLRKYAMTMSFLHPMAKASIDMKKWLEKNPPSHPDYEATQSAVRDLDHYLTKYYDRYVKAEASASDAFSGKGKPKGKIMMSRADFKREHMDLIKLLRKSSDPAILAEADAQEKEMKAMLGGGLFSNIAKGFKNVVTRVADVFKGVRRDYPPDVRQTLAVIGNHPIVDMNIRRDPIRDMLNTAFNLVTRGKWNEVRKKYAYDKLFHLGVEITLADGRKYVAEKNQTLNIAPAKPSDSQTERMPVNLPAGNMTVNEMLFKTQQRQGDKYFLYDAFSNNCQDWISDLLVANGLSTPQNLAFVKQPLDNVLAELPSYTQGFARVATDLGALADVALKGRGRARPHPAFAKQLREVGIKPMEYIGAVRSLAKKNGYEPMDVSFSDTPEHKIAIKRPDGGITRAGRVGYGDFIIWSYMEARKMTPAGTADKKRDTFRKSHSKIKGDWKADKFSPNNIALNLLW